MSGLRGRAWRSKSWLSKLPRAGKGIPTCSLVSPSCPMPVAGRGQLRVPFCRPSFQEIAVPRALIRTSVKSPITGLRLGRSGSQGGLRAEGASEVIRLLRRAHRSAYCPPSHWDRIASCHDAVTMAAVLPDYKTGKRHGGGVTRKSRRLGRGGRGRHARVQHSPTRSVFGSGVGMRGPERPPPALSTVTQSLKQGFAAPRAAKHAGHLTPSRATLQVGHVQTGHPTEATRPT